MILWTGLVTVSPFMRYVQYAGNYINAADVVQKGIYTS